MDMKIIGNEVISASAGSGKTYQLAFRYLRLVERGVPPETIVALTFSRMAAHEILDKIMGMLRAWIQDPKDFGRAVEAGFPQVERRRLVEMLRRIAMSIHQLRIGTLDSFFVAVLKAFPFEFGMAPDFELLDERTEGIARIEVLDDVLWSCADPSARAEFLEEFKMATFGLEEKRLRSCLERFVKNYHDKYLLAPDGALWAGEGILPPDTPFLVERKNISQKARRLIELLEGRGDMDARLLNSCVAFLEEAALFSRSSLFSDDAKECWEKRVLPLVGDYMNGAAAIAFNKKQYVLSVEECALFDDVSSHVLRCQIEDCLAATRGIHAVLRRYDEAYDRLVRANGSLTFKDVLHLLSGKGRKVGRLSAARDDDTMLYIQYRLDGSYHHWMLDEFQDTSVDQWCVLENLIDEVLQDESGTKSFFYVGDTKQAIYQWRSGDPALFEMAFETLAARFPGQLEKRPLSTSYRSRQEVMDAVNAVFGGLSAGRLDDIVARGVVERFQWRTHHVVEQNAGKAGYAALIEFPRIDGGGESMELKARYIAGKVAELDPFSKKMSVGVLVRENRSGAVLADCLRAARVPCSVEGESGIVDNALVLGFLSLFKFARHPGDTLAWEHLLMTPFGRFIRSKETLCATLLEDVHDKGFAAVVAQWGGKLAEVCPFDEFHKGRLDDLLRAAAVFDAGGSRNCLEFVEFVQEFSTRSKARKGTVEILTIHKSKGLDYDIVFLPDLNADSITAFDADGVRMKKNVALRPEWCLRMPSKAVAKHVHPLDGLLEDLAEEGLYSELCVLYVGMTRARRALYLLADASAKTSKTPYPAVVLKKLLGGDSPLRSVEEYGVSVWYEAGDESAMIADHGREEIAPPREPIRLSFGFDSVAQKATPSREEDFEVDLSSQFTGERERRLSVGVAVHELFELIEWVEGCVPDDLYAAWRKTASCSAQVAAEAGNIFSKALSGERVRRELTRPAGNVELWRERRFETILGGKWVSGAWDRVLVHKDATGAAEKAVIIDFKTDVVASADDVRRLEDRYRGQQRMYRDVLAHALNLSPSRIETRLLFTSNA